MRILNAEAIEKAASYDEIIEAVKASFIAYEKQTFTMPDRAHIDYRGNTLLLMPCFANFGFSTKLVSVFPENNKKNRPVIQGAVLLNDPDTGEPVALLNGTKLTALRTAAVGALAARYLIQDKVETLGLIGAGVQGFQQVLFALTNKSIQTVLVHGPHAEKLDAFIKKLNSRISGVTIKAADSVEMLVNASQQVITATTSDVPVLPDDTTLLKNTCFIGIGSFKPGMREFPEALFRLVDQCFIDTAFAVKETGDLAYPIEMGWIDREAVFTLGKLIKGEVALSGSATTLFKSVGMALFDLFVSQLIYDKSIEKDIGIDVTL